jgi:cell wall-associated NlpC family hydrolase
MVASADSTPVNTGDATDVTATTATLNGSASVSGPSPLAVFQYGTTPALGLTAMAEPSSNASEGSFSASVGDLQPGSTYYFRLAEVLGSTTTAGTTLSFVTSASSSSSSPSGSGGGTTTTTTPPATTTTPPNTPTPSAPQPPAGSKHKGTSASGGASPPAPSSSSSTSSAAATVSAVQGYWTVTSNGIVSSYGGAPTYGDAHDVPLAHPIVDIAATPDGAGYWLIASDGGVFTYGDAAYFGSPAGGRFTPKIVSLTPTPDGHGYWMLASDGGILAYGDAASYGSPSDLALTTPVVGMATTPDGQGYWVVSADGGVFTYGDASFYGSAATEHLAEAAVGIVATPDGRGYWVAAADGGVFAYGDAAFYGSGSGRVGVPTIASIATTGDGQGYRLVTPTGGTLDFGDAASVPGPATPPPQPVVAIAVPFRHALADVPMYYVVLDRQAAATCPGLPWTVLAAIAKVESNFGRSTLPGVSSGTNPWGAAGPMQMGIGGAAGRTFQAYDHPVAADTTPTPAPPGATPQNPWDPTDAVYAATRDLCTNGGGNPGTLNKAILAYNHAQWYATEVEALAAQYGGGESSTLSGAAELALSQVGVPYQWGGSTPQQGFDCSGLVQWAYAMSGTKLPRTSQLQWATLPHLPANSPLVTGDLVFFGPAEGPTHVGIYLGNGFMVDAPHTGATVRVEPYNWSDYLGAAVP